MKKQQMIGGICSLLFGLSGCFMKEAGYKKEQGANLHQDEHVAFDYANQKEWQIVSGQMQSPINIVTEETEAWTAGKGNLTLDYPFIIEKLEDNGHSIQATTNGQATIDERPFHLTQYHFHTPSEHTVDGKRYPMEAHFVHKAQNGRLAVIGVFFEEGEENAGLTEIEWILNDEMPLIVPHLFDLIPENKSYYHYLGSLTTPSLDENVEWYVLKEPVSISKEQLHFFKDVHEDNHREIQPLNARVVLEYNE